MKIQKPRLALVVAYGVMAMGGMGFVGMAGGCNQHGLFMDADASTESRLRYWGNDSARTTTESRKRGTDMGFGIPGLGGSQ